MAPYSIPCTSVSPLPSLPLPSARSQALRAQKIDSCNPPHSQRDVFTTLPPELLLQIWRDPELHLSPSSVAISSTLLPYARRNAYRQLHVDSDITLAALGERLALNPELGELVDEVEIKQEQRRGGDFGGGSAWLEASFVKAFEGLTRVQRISMNRRDVGELLTPRIMSSAAFRSAGRLELASEESNIEWLALRYLHLSTGLRELEIKTPMKYQAGAPSGMFEPRTSRIEKLAISAEPHSAGESAGLRDLRRPI